jgi:hypothetical protein
VTKLAAEKKKTRSDERVFWQAVLFFLIKLVYPLW